MLAERPAGPHRGVCAESVVMFGRLRRDPLEKQALRINVFCAWPDPGNGGEINCFLFVSD